MAHWILHLAKTTRGSRDARALVRDEIINSLRSRPSAARSARISVFNRLKARHVSPFAWNLFDGVAVLIFFP